jgi:hypothetical protein
MVTRTRTCNLTLVLCLTLHVSAAPSVPCPCRWWVGDAQRVLAVKDEGANQRKSHCAHCETGKNSLFSQHFPLTNHCADPYAAPVHKTPLPHDHTVASAVALLHRSPLPSPDAHRLQVLLE